MRAVFTGVGTGLRLASMAGVLSLVSGVALAEAPAEVCLAASKDFALGARLARTAARLDSGERLIGVALGSSSTSGLWMVNKAWTYPHITERELARLRPGSVVEIINSGKLGDTISGMVERLRRDVLYHRPELVVWQLGTNDVVWGGRADGLRDLIIQGVRALKAGQADVVLMDMQYAPWVRRSSQHTHMQATIAEAARLEHVGLFSRYHLMRRAVEAGLSPHALVSWDGLHNSAAGYDCVGRALARAIDAAAR